MKTLKCLVMAILLSAAGASFAAEETPKEKIEQIQKRRLELFESYQRAKAQAESLRKMDLIEAELRRMDEEEKRLQAEVDKGEK
jgi:predicted nuclease with TOPRIM domain